MISSPLGITTIVNVLTIATLLMNGFGSGGKHDHADMETMRNPGVSPDTTTHTVSVNHEYIGHGLKRDYLVKIDIPDSFPEHFRWNLSLSVPRSLIVDVFRQNRVGHNIFTTDQPVDIERGTWSASSQPFRLTAQVDAKKSKRILFQVPEMMARYHLPGQNCFTLDPPDISFAGVDGSVSVQYPQGLRQCVPVSSPNIIVPVLTILAPVASCLYLINLIKSL